ncbi:MAG: hypothetical protein GY716_13130 [bacterium]|nr:hypothetical protein [bacterium]
MTTRRSIAIIGAGPIGLEALLQADALGFDARLFEAGRVGEHVRRWGHVRLFSPWHMNHSPLGLRLLEAGDDPLPGAEDFLTGAEYADVYLDRLGRHERLAPHIRARHRLVAVTREGLGKSDLVGGPRDRRPFRMLFDTPDGERIEHADVVIDCSGTFGNPNWMGSGNIPALGERELREEILYTLPDLGEAPRSEWAGRHVLVVGSGQSAATALDQLVGLPRTRVTWVARDSGSTPLPVIDDDPLPERRRLSERANALAQGADPAVSYLDGAAIQAIRSVSGGYEATVSRGDSRRTVVVNRVLALVGHSPDNALYRELQVHECYATFGPMKLAAGLLADAGGDCLARKSTGAESLGHPEPDFYILGAKSYGKNSSFLIRLGLEQVRAAFVTISARASDDATRAPRV